MARGKPAELPAQAAQGTVLRGCPYAPHLVDAPHASENLSLNKSADFRV